MKEETGKTHVCGTIKPLVWRTKAPQLYEYNPAKIYASGIGGRYCVDSTGGDVLLWDAADPSVWTQHGTVKDAKAAAQADYEARISAQIQPDAEPIGWQTIETAPRDGAPFLAYDGSYVYECWFVNDPYDGSYLQDHADSEPNPTHWMPLPLAPDAPQAAPTSAVGDLAGAISELRGLIQCRCHESYLNRGLHDPSCNYGAAGSVETIIRALTEAGE